MDVRRAAAAATVAACTLALAACGSTSSTSAGEGVTVANVDLARKAEFTVVPATTTLKAGKVDFTVRNDGKTLHEMVVVKLPANGLAGLTQADGSASEAGKIGEAADIDPGASKSVTLTLAAGKYALICNQPGHFAGGMHTVITVA